MLRLTVNTVGVEPTILSDVRCIPSCVKMPALTRESYPLRPSCSKDDQFDMAAGIEPVFRRLSTGADVLTITPNPLWPSVGVVGVEPTAPEGRWFTATVHYRLDTPKNIAQ